MFKKLTEREIKGHPKEPLDVCYLVFCNNQEICNAKFMKGFLSEDAQSEDISSYLFSATAYDTEAAAERAFLEYVKKCRGFTFSVTKYHQSNKKEDLQENAYWILKINGKSNEVTTSLRCRSTTLNEKILTIKNNLRTESLCKEEVMKKSDAKKAKPS